jgi:hypothetical protein
MVNYLSITLSIYLSLFLFTYIYLYEQLIDCRGGGGGGVLRLVYTEAGNGTQFTGESKVMGGSSTGQMGFDGVSIGEGCAAGRGGLLCDACPPGHFSPHGTCEPCPVGISASRRRDVVSFTFFMLSSSP